MRIELLRPLAGACAAAALLGLAACGDPGTETAAERQTQATTAASGQPPAAPEQEAAARAAAQADAATRLSQGRGS